MLRTISISLILHCISVLVQAQTDQDIIDKYMENLLELNEEGNELQDLRGLLQSYLDHPVNLNKMEAEEIRSLAFLTALQQEAIIRHIIEFGPFIDIHELQVIEAFTQEELQNILPFIVVKEQMAEEHRFRDFKKHNKQEFRFNFRTDQPLASGYTSPYSSAYTGDPLYMQITYRGYYRNLLSWGFRMEKDAGESLIVPGTIQADFTSFYLGYKGPGTLSSLVLGDFQISVGQGLTFSNGYGSIKSGNLSSIKMAQRPFGPYRANRENAFLRGIALQIKTGKLLSGAFASMRSIDCYVRKDGNLLYTRSISEGSGLHRNSFELLLRDAAKDKSAGLMAELNMRRGTFGLISVYRQLSLPVLPEIKAYNYFYFRGQSYFSTGMYYDIHLSGINFYGELSTSNQAIAMVHGALLSVNRQLDLGLVYREYPPDFITFFSNAIGEQSRNANERGLYLGLNYRIAKKADILAHADIYSFPWLRFEADAPGYGREHWIELKIRHSKSAETRLRLRKEIKTYNGTGDRIDPVRERTRKSIRLQFSVKMYDFLEYRLRIEQNIYQLDELHKGQLMYMEAIYKPKFSPWKAAVKVGRAVIDDYDSRIYSYEQSPPGIYPLHNFYFSGTRYYLLLKRKFNRLEMQFKYSIDHHFIAADEMYPESSTGSGNEERVGPNKHTFVLQIVMRNK